MNVRLTVTAAAATVAASVALSPLLQTLNWFWASAGAVVVAAAVGGATRLRVLPVAASLLAGLAAEFLYLNLLFAGPQSWGWLVPTGASVHHLGTLISEAMREVAVYAPPVPLTSGILLLTVAGVGFVAVITDVLAVRLRRPAIAGLPLLVLFCVPLTTGTSSTGLGAVLVFCLSMAGYLALLLAESRDRLRLWGRVVRTWESRGAAHEPDTRRLSVAGRRIGFAAVLIALVVPLVLPTMTHRRLFTGSGIAGVGGGGTIALPEPLVQLSSDLHRHRPETVLTYHSSSGPHYLQVYVLTKLSTQTWTLAAPRNSVLVGSGSLPPVPGLSRHTVRYTDVETIHLTPALTTGGRALDYLPVPYAPRSVKVPGQWRVTRSSLSIYGPGTRLGGLTYRVTSDKVSPTGQQLAAAPAPAPALRGYLTYPGVFGQLAPLAGRITAGQTTARAKAAALQSWFLSGGGFTYTLQAPQPDSAHALIDFLTRPGDRHGYCQQFAFGMAVLARLAGIPSRVVVGFTGGTYTGHGNWRVTTADAHAWPELYFQGAGWLRFEPTPSGGLGQATATIPGYTFPATGASTHHPHHSTPVTGPTAPAPTGPSPGALGGRGPHGGSGTGKAGPVARPSGSFPFGLLALLLVAVAALAPRTARSVARRRRWLRAAGDTARAHAAWRELHDDLADYRVAVRPSESPRALARRLAGSLGFAEAGRDALERIARAEERATYAAGPVPSERLRADVATVRRATARAVSPAVRWAAVLLPASVLTHARAAVQNALDVFGWIDVIGGRLGRHPGDPGEGVTSRWRS